MTQLRADFSIIPTRPVTGVDAQLDFDATTSRNRNRQGTAIRHPKQSGSDGLVDDVDLHPIVISVTAHFTDYPSFYGPGLAGYDGRAEALLLAHWGLKHGNL